jgi:hypothetical protein
MPVFISHSHADSDFVDKLAASIVKNRGSVWLDRWELNVGDSMIGRIQKAIAGSTALLVVLSKSSVQSVWVQKELAAGLMRELEENRVLVLPVLLEDCDVPAFLREKLHADFRYDFDKGFKAVLEAIAAVTNSEQNRIEGANATLDWAIDWGFDEGGLFNLSVTIAEAPKEIPVTIVTEVRISANEAATARYRQYEEMGLDWLGRIMVAEMVAKVAEEQEYHLVLDDQRPQVFEAVVQDANSPRRFDVAVVSRRVGMDTGKLQVVGVGGYLSCISGFLEESSGKLTSEETKALVKLLTSPAN